MQSQGLPITALVLAGGMGTRLRSVVSDRPKPMALVNGAPFIEILIDSLAAKGIREFVLLVGYMADVIEKHFAARNDKDLRIKVFIRTNPTGNRRRCEERGRFCQRSIPVNKW